MSSDASHLAPPMLQSTSASSHLNGSAMRSCSPPLSPILPRANGTHSVLLYTSYNHRESLFGTLREFFTSRGHEFDRIGGSLNYHSAFKVVKKVRKATLVIIWNGDEPGDDWLRRVCMAHGKPFLVAEQGLLPQAGYWHLDPSGITGRSSLCGSLDWVTDQMIARSKEYIARHFKARDLRYTGDGGYVLVPLQLPYDTSIYLHGATKSIIDFVRHVRDQHEGRIVVSLHPKNRDQPLPDDVTDVVVATENTIKTAQRARLVVGQTSTVLYETAALGAPTVALGNCPMAVHGQSDLARLLAAVVARQIPRSVHDLTPWFESLGVVF